MIANVQDVERWLRANKCQWWQIRSTDRENTTVFETDMSSPQEERFSNFQHVMSLCKGGLFIIYAAEKEGAKKGRFREEFSNLGASSASVSVSGFTGGTVPDGYLSRQEVEAMIQSERMKSENERLKEENQRFSEENNRMKEPIQTMIRELAPLAPSLIAGFLGRGVVPAAVGTLDVIEDTESSLSISESEMSKLESYIADWMEADNDWLVLIGKISQMAKEKNTMYGTAKGILLNM